MTVLKEVRAILVSVNFDDFLALTLPHNSRFFSETIVVTHPDDKATQRVVERVPGSTCFVTDAFYRNGADFNKWLALEEGLDSIGRSGWILVTDADIILPPTVPDLTLTPGYLYGAERLVVSGERDWFPIERAWECARDTPAPRWCGYFQLFHGSDRNCDRKPWYNTDLGHAAIADEPFRARWSPETRRLLPFSVLHFGDVDQNWFGRVTPRLDGGPLPPLPDAKRKMQELLDEVSDPELNKWAQQ